MTQILLDAGFNRRQASNVLQGVDVSFKKSKFDSDPLSIPMGTEFNTCSSDPDDGYSAYRTAVHEAGHALGLSNFDYIDLVRHSKQFYEAAHPTIPDSVLNYDDEVPTDWATWAPSPLNEPDCSPHPFDVMAIYALYQTAPSAVIEGPVRQREQTEVQLRVGQVSNLTPELTYEWTTSWPGLQFSPNNRSSSVSVRLPDVSASDSVEERTVTIEVKVTDSEGTMTRDSHEIEVLW